VRTKRGWELEDRWRYRTVIKTSGAKNRITELPAVAATTTTTTSKLLLYRQRQSCSQLGIAEKFNHNKTGHEINKKNLLTNFPKLEMWTTTTKRNIQFDRIIGSSPFYPRPQRQNVVGSMKIFKRTIDRKVNLFWCLHHQPIKVFTRLYPHRFILRYGHIECLGRDNDSHNRCCLRAMFESTGRSLKGDGIAECAAGSFGRK
jgi:hypothetical protein